VKRAFVIVTDPAGSLWLGTYSQGPQGSYRFTELPAGVFYSVEGMKDGVGYDAVVDVPVIAGETTLVDLYLWP
jgi:hypothetical protein